ncbi:MAG: ATP-binding cassette domain-containing protein [Planctomycetota bacterium]|nr:ATP-binding cassette domain-containing protein [Planctomycetota bacterium]
MALLEMREVTMGFRGPPLLDKVNFHIDHGERVCLLGRNGTGKSTLMRLVRGFLVAEDGSTKPFEPDDGTITRRQGLRAALLDQEVPTDLRGTIFDLVSTGLGQRGRLLADYHRVSHQMAVEHDKSLQAELDRLTHELDHGDGWLVHREVDQIISLMELDPDADVSVLSAGMKRRVLLAKAICSKPDILLLDEPTNHLDIAAVAWLEEFLLGYGGTLLFVTHDRMLLRKLATRIVDLDRGELRSWACDYDTFLTRKEAALQAQSQQQTLFDKKLAQEEVWIRKGILARRTRNEGRVRALKQMREVRGARRELSGPVRMKAQTAERSGRMVVEAKGLLFAYGDDEPVIRNLTTTIMRGDRIGIIGPNGSGKTTLLRVLLGQLEAQQGKLRHGTRLEVSYFDQLQEQLDGERTVQENVSPGTDMLSINGQRKHVIGYLQDFLFSAEQARMPVKFLSGGEHNRVLLARLFTRPSNVLVMDEPTNDLDMETLELLEELLMDFPGTLLLVSHDREFLNNVVTSTLVLEGQGRVKEYAGGYDDWLMQRKGPVAAESEKPSGKLQAKPKSKAKQPDGRQRLTYGEKLELEKLPARIEELEQRQDEIHERMSALGFFEQDRETVERATTELKAVEKDLAEVNARWEDLEERAG